MKLSLFTSFATNRQVADCVSYSTRRALLRRPHEASRRWSSKCTANVQPYKTKQKKRQQLRRRHHLMTRETWRAPRDGNSVSRGGSRRQTRDQRSFTTKHGQSRHQSVDDGSRHMPTSRRRRDAATSSNRGRKATTSIVPS